MTIVRKLMTVLLVLFVFVMPALAHEIHDAAQKGDLAKIKTYHLGQKPPMTYRQVENSQARITELQCLDEQGGVSWTVNRDQPGPNWPHIIIALDGVPYELVEELYDLGHFRLFHRPVRLISTFPSMTDLAFWKVFGGKKPLSYQAKHYNPDLNLICDCICEKYV